MPPLWVACSNIQTIGKAGEWGMGALGFLLQAAPFDCVMLAGGCLTPLPDEVVG